MPDGRPALPAEIKRAVLLEAGHRCAVCGEPCPLELAHIIPWRDNRVHAASNLICLCASCHARADTENWGKKTLEAYKRNPWILRRGPSWGAMPMKRLTLSLEMAMSEFDDAAKDRFRYMLAGFLGIPVEDIQVVTVEEGSTIVTVDVPELAALELNDAYYEQAEGLYDRFRAVGLPLIPPESGASQLATPTSFDLLVYHDGTEPHPGTRIATAMEEGGLRTWTLLWRDSLKEPIAAGEVRRDVEHTNVAALLLGENALVKDHLFETQVTMQFLHELKVQVIPVMVGARLEARNTAQYLMAWNPQYVSYDPTEVQLRRLRKLVSASLGKRG